MRPARLSLSHFSPSGLATGSNGIRDDGPGYPTVSFTHTSELIVDGVAAYLRQRRDIGDIKKSAGDGTPQSNESDGYNLTFKVASLEGVKSILLNLAYAAGELAKAGPDVTAALIKDGVRLNLIGQRGEAQRLGEVLECAFGPVPEKQRDEALALLERDPAEAERLYGPLKPDQAKLRTNISIYISHDRWPHGFDLTCEPKKGHPDAWNLIEARAYPTPRRAEVKSFDAAWTARQKARVLQRAEH